MLSEKVCFSSDLKTDDREYCLTSSELLGSKNLYIYLERFSNIIIKEEPEYYDFLNRYFNDEGYIDIWRIPHLLIDLYNDKTGFHEQRLCDESFRTRFMSFIADFYNYCMKKGILLSVEKNQYTNYDYSIFFMQKNQCLYNLIVETYCRIYHNLNSYGSIKKGAECYE
jgi:hypothetical protein